MNVIKIEEIKENTYKITYQENESYKVTLCENTFNYDFKEIKTIPEKVIDFVEDWILGEL